jgi:hypothetical protein
VKQPYLFKLPLSPFGLMARQSPNSKSGQKTKTKIKIAVWQIRLIQAAFSAFENLKV